MTTVTIDSLRTRVRERCDMVGSSFVVDNTTGVDAFINEANQKLHALLVDAFGEEYVSSVSTFTTAASTNDYAVPSGFYKLYGVEIARGGKQYSIPRFTRAERNAYRNSNVAANVLNHELRYSLIGSNIRIYPTPPAGLTGSILYAPEATTLTTGSSVSYPNGWERFIVIDAAIQILMKEESSVTGLQAERKEILDAIKLEKEQRDLAESYHVVDVFNDEDGLW